MIQLVYVSSATVTFGKPELLDLLAKSRVNNEKLKITGLLLFKDGNFLQILEGEAAVVLPLYEKISQDIRHAGILKLLQTQPSARDFPDWSMAFRDLRDFDLVDYPGYNEFLNLPLTDQSLSKDPSKAKRLISVFRTAMR